MNRAKAMGPKGVVTIATAHFEAFSRLEQSGGGEALFEDHIQPAIAAALATTAGNRFRRCN